MSLHLYANISSAPHNTPACELLGDHGANAAINCSELATLFDEMGPRGGSTDGINDNAIQISLTDIDVRDPDSDSNLFEFRLNIWFDRVNDVSTHQNCLPNGECTSIVTNRVGVLNANGDGLVPFDEDNDTNIISTEDAGGNNLNNYNNSEEPYPNDIEYPMFYQPGAPGTPILRYKSFTNIVTNYNSPNSKHYDQIMAAGETRPFSLDMQMLNANKLDSAFDNTTVTFCDKIDTEVFEYAGVAPPNTVGNPPLHPYNQNRDYNPVLRISGPGAPTTRYVDGKDHVKFLFSNKPHTSPNPTQSDYLNALRANTCDDDVNSDGVVNIVDKDGNQSNPGNPVDWWEDPETVPGGMPAITLVRQDMLIDRDMAREVKPSFNQIFFSVNHLIKAKLITSSPYGTNNRLPNFASSKHPILNGGNWQHAHPRHTDPTDDVNFSLTRSTVDRMTLVPSAHAVKKFTSPKGVRIVKGGEIVDFVIQPTVHGYWDVNTIDEATLEDTLPNRINYVGGSERFSVDGGSTWLTRADYDASNPDITITSVENTAGSGPLRWEFDSVEPGEQLPLIKYKVMVDPDVISADFTNVVTLDSGIIGNDEQAKALYKLKVLPQNGLEVKKYVDEPVYATNTPFSYQLKYKNLGAQDFTQAEFIDVLPFEGDSAGTTGGLASGRAPASKSIGQFEIASITGSNGETFYATDAVPADIPQDICHEDNQASGYTPSTGDICYAMYVNNGNQFSGGATAGTGNITWTQCSDASCSNVPNATAIRFTTGAIAANSGANTIDIELSPIGNKGGEPDLDDDNRVTGNSTGSIYTNNFGGRVPEISLQVISNDVSVTMVSGSIGDYVWLDDNGDGVQDPSESAIAGAELALLDSSGSPIYVDSNGNVVPAGTVNAIELKATTDANGKYLFDNLPPGDYQVKVISLPTSAAR